MKKFLIATAVIMGLALIGFVVSFAIYGIDFSDLPTAIYAVSDKDFKQESKAAALANDGIICVNASNNRIFVQNHDGDEVLITYYTSKYTDFSFDEEEGKITVKIKTNFWDKNIFKLSFQTNKTDKINIFLPNSFAGSLDLTTSNSEIELDAQNSFLDVMLKSSNDSIDLKNVRAGSINAKTSNSKISGVGVFGSGVFKTSNGKIDLDLDCADIVADTSNDAVKLRVKGEATGYKLNLSTSNGSIKLDGNNMGKKYITTEGDKSLVADTSNDNISVVFY